MFVRSLASGRGSFVKTASVVPGGFEVAVDSFIVFSNATSALAKVIR